MAAATSEHTGLHHDEMITIIHYGHDRSLPGCDRNSASQRPIRTGYPVTKKDETKSGRAK
jgi:hypothetical protein